MIGCMHMAIGACVVLLLQLLASQGAAVERGGAAVHGPSLRAAGTHKQGELLVKFRDGVSESDKERLHARNGSKMLKQYPRLGIHKVRIPDGLRPEHSARAYRSDPMVAYAEPNAAVGSLLIPNDASLDLLWSLDNHGQTGGIAGADIGAFDAWDITTGVDGVVVAVIDTGVDYRHSDMAANMWVNEAEARGLPGIDDDGNGYVDDVHGISVLDYSADPMDDHGHGTHVAGIIGAVGNNGRGVAGLNWSTRVMACKFLDRFGSGYIDGALECLEYVRRMRERGVNIVATNNSWGGPGYFRTLFDAIASQEDMLFIAAAGNSHADNDVLPFSPGGFRLPHLISVAATDHNDQMAWFSSYGRRSVWVGAPGVDIISLRAQGTDMYGDGRHFAGETEEPEYYRASGTSMAAPYVTGLAALLASRYPDARWTEVRNLILSGGDVLPALEGGTVTGRRVHAYGSLSCTDGKVFSALEYSFDVGIPNLLTALSIDCTQPVGPVVVTTSSGDAVSLLDDGIAPDRFAGDGIFTALWVPTCSDTSLTFSSPLGTDTVTPGPSVDLTISEMEGPQRAYTGGEIAVRVRLKNAGSVDAPFFSVFFYLSKDAAITSDDIALGNLNVPSLEAGQEQTLEATVRVPGGVEGGTYHLGALVDFPDTIEESNETNNVFTSGEMTIEKAYADLVVSAVAGPARAETGRTIAVKASVQNVGKLAAPFFSVFFYLSRDAAITSDDIALGNVNVPSLAAGQERELETAVRMPDGIDSGTYYLGVLVDFPDTVKESDETNNAAFGSAISVQRVFPDLVVSAVSSVQSVVAGRQFTVTGKVRNQGRAPLGRLVLAVYISPDAVITRMDTAVGTVTLDTIQSGEERGFVTTVTVPLTQRAGIHYIGAIADPWNQVAESNEGNNTRAGNAVTVRKPSRSTPLY